MRSSEKERKKKWKGEEEGVDIIERTVNIRRSEWKMYKLECEGGVEMWRKSQSEKKKWTYLVKVKMGRRSEKGRSWSMTKLTCEGEVIILNIGEI